MEIMHEAKTGLVAHLETFAGNTIEFIRSESPLLIDGVGIPDIDVDMHRRHVVVVADKPRRRRTSRAQTVHQGVPAGAGRRQCQRRRAAQGPAIARRLIVGTPADQRRGPQSGAQVGAARRRRRPRARPGAHPGPRHRRLHDLPAAGSAADLALLLADHHGASLIVTAGHSASIEEFFDRSRQQSNPSTFLTRLKVGEKARRRESRCHAVPQPGFGWSSRDAGAGDADRGHRRAVGLEHRHRRHRLDRAVLEPLPAVGPAPGELGACRDFSSPACDFTGGGVPRARHRCGLGSGVLSDTLLSGPRDQKKDLQGQIAQLTDDKERAQRKASAAADDFNTQMSGRMVHDAPAGKTVVLIRTRTPPTTTTSRR